MPVHILNPCIDPKEVANFALSQHPYLHMLYQCLLNLQCCDSGQELKTYHGSQSKKHYGPVLVNHV